MAGYTINDLKKASSINPLDKLPIQQSGVTRQIEAGMLDNATIINSGDNTGVIREAKTFVIENNSTSLQITLGDAVGRIVSDNEFTDSPEAAKGWVITVINNSTRNHALFHGNYSETLAPGDVIHYYWNGARWTVHSLAVDRLTVTGSASFGGTISGSGFESSVKSLLTDNPTVIYKNAPTIEKSGGTHEIDTKSFGTGIFLVGISFLNTASYYFGFLTKSSYNGRLHSFINYALEVTYDDSDKKLIVKNNNNYSFNTFITITKISSW